MALAHGSTFGLFSSKGDRDGNNGDDIWKN